MKSLWANIFKKEDNNSENISSILKKVPIFSDLSPNDLKALVRILHRRNYRREEIIFKEGDVGVGMYIVEKGTVFVRLEQSGEIVAELSDGEFFGELSLLDDSPRSATVIAKSECKMLGFFQPDLFGLIKRNPRLGVKIVIHLANIIGERLKAANFENLELRMKLKSKEEKI
jgi:CRP/FNR family cyclic AMP-dependent transcriptional regulator